MLILRPLFPAPHRFISLSFATRVALFFAGLLLVNIGAGPIEANESADCSVLKVLRMFNGQELESNVVRFILIQDSRISAIKVERPTHTQACRFYDLTAYTVLPGLIDGHTHILLTDRSYGRDLSSELNRNSAAGRLQRLKLADVYARSLLHAGFTTLRDLGNSGRYLDLEWRRQHASGIWPRMIASGPGLATGSAQFRSEDSLLGRAEYSIVSTPDDVREAVRTHLRAGVDLIKAYADNDPSPGGMGKNLLGTAVAAAHAGKVKITAHATTDESAYDAVQAGVDSIEHGEVLSERTLKAMATHQVYLVPTDFSRRICALISRHNPDPIYLGPAPYCAGRSQRLQAALRVGVPIAFGSDMYLNLADRGRASLETLFAYVEEGASPLDAIRAATSGGAGLLGRVDLGVIKQGAQADLIAVAGHPFQTIRDIGQLKFVMKAGISVCGAISICQ